MDVDPVVDVGEGDLEGVKNEVRSLRYSKWDTGANMAKMSMVRPMMQEVVNEDRQDS